MKGLLPVILSRPILPLAFSVNQIAPSGPVERNTGLAKEVGMVYRVMAPPVVMRPISLLLAANHRAPSGPLMILDISPTLGKPNSVTSPEVVIRSMWLPYRDVNQIAPSGPLASPPMPVRLTGNSVMTPAVVIRPIWFAEFSTNQRAPSEPATISVG